MKSKHFSHGTLEQFESLVRDRIDELSGDVESCDKIMSADDGDKYDKQKTWDEVESSLKNKGIECELTPEDDALVVYCGTTQYNVPYKDLHLDDAHIQDDVDYIVGYIYDDQSDDESDAWEEVRSKSVRDSDGFLTDYTLYHNIATDEYVCMFGDKDLYRPEDGNWDAGPFETESEAYEWFDNYDETRFDEE